MQRADADTLELNCREADLFQHAPYDPVAPFVDHDP
jgi:hypothetical protein